MRVSIENTSEFLQVKPVFHGKDSLVKCTLNIPVTQLGMPLIYLSFSPGYYLHP